MMERDLLDDIPPPNHPQCPPPHKSVGILVLIKVLTKK